jgi:DNA-binding NtrC family response regulator
MGQSTIVLVDDLDFVRDVIEMMLDKKGYTVYSFADPADALAVSENIQVDLFLVDMMMPKISGMEVLKRLLAAQKPFEVLMITGKNDTAEAAEALRIGAYGVLQKPFTRAELLTFVEYALASAAAKKHYACELMDKQQGNGLVDTEK